MARRRKTQVKGQDARGRPGRRSAEERKGAVLELLSGKASVDQVATRFGVLPETVERWRSEALEAVEAAMRRGAKSPEERQLERENRELRQTLADVSIREALLRRALEEERKNRPTRPARSRR
jgi:transposase-like protein